jgi:Dockerin type I domain
MLTGVSNQQYISVVLVNAKVSTGAIGNVIGPQMGVLIGDINGDGQAHSGDLILMKRQMLQSVNNNRGTSDFREDVNADGNVDSGDLMMISNAIL